MQARTYLNFDLSIRIDDSGVLDVAVLESPAGEAHESHEWPFNEQDLEIFLLRIGHTRRGVRRIDSPEMEAARDFGVELYDAVFAGQIGTSFERSIDEAERHGKGLRVRLRTHHAPELSDVPWEFLYSPSLHRFLTVSTSTPLVRYVEQSRLIPPLAIEGAVQILTMVSSPTDVATLDVEDEWARINDSLSGLASRGLIDIRRLPQATMAALQRELRQRPYHVFHFIGHGGFDTSGDEGVLMFEDDRGRGHKVSGEHLGTILHDHESLRLVVLNSCEGARPAAQDPFGGTAQGLVRQGIPAVIGMQFEITDDAAITFSHDFYEAIADGYPVDAALAEARKAIFTSGNDVEWGTPVLHMRTPDGRIFDKPEPTATPQLETTGELAALLAEPEAALRRSDYERAVVLLESIVRDNPESYIAVDKLAGAKRSLRADRLYASARVLSQAEQWQAVVDRFVEIEALDPNFPDGDGLLPAAMQALAEEARDTRLDTLYRAAEAASFARDWDQTIRLLDEVSAENPDYRDVAARLEEANVWRDAGTLLAAATAAFDAEDWEAVIDRFDELRLLGSDFADDPDDLESRARIRLDQEEQRHRLQAEYDAAIALIEEEKWSDALKILDGIESERPDFPGISKLRDTTREQARRQDAAKIQEQAAALYTAAVAHAAEEQWDKVIETLDQLDELAPDYPGADPLRDRAHARQQAVDGALLGAQTGTETSATDEATSPAVTDMEARAESEAPATPAKSSRAVPLMAGVGGTIALVVVVIVGSIALFGDGGDGETGGGTSATTAGDEGTTAPATPEGPAVSGFAQQIQQRGVIRVGSGGSSVLTDFDQALTIEIVQRLFGELPVEFVPVQGAERWDALKSGQIELLVAQIWRFSSRDEAELATYTGNYLLDGLVLSGEFVNGLSDLQGATVAAATGIELAVIQLFESNGITAELLTFETFGEVHAALTSGAADAAVGYDSSFHIVDPSLATIWTGEGVVPVVAAVPLEEVEFAAEVDAAIHEIVEDGTWLQLYRNAFGTDPPYTIDEMRSAPVPNR